MLESYIMIKSVFKCLFLLAFLLSSTTQASVSLNGSSRVNALDVSRIGQIETGFYRANPKDLRFSQSDASPFFSNGMRVDDTIAALRSGALRADDVGSPIQVVQHQGKLFSLDNRRLATFQHAGVGDIPVEIVSLKNPDVYKRFISRFDPIDGEGLNIVFATSQQREAAQRLLVEFNKIRGIQLQ